MKKSLLLAAILSFHTLSAFDVPQISHVTSNVGSELDQLDTLTTVTKKNLDVQLSLKKQIEHYQKLQQLFLTNPDDKEFLFQIIKQAYKIQEVIKTYHLEYAFSQEFLKELALFAQVANKRGIPKP